MQQSVDTRTDTTPNKLSMTHYRGRPGGEHPTACVSFFSGEISGEKDFSSRHKVSLSITKQTETVAVVVVVTTLSRSSLWQCCCCCRETRSPWPAAANRSSSLKSPFLLR